MVSSWRELGLIPNTKTSLSEPPPTGLPLEFQKAPGKRAQLINVHIDASNRGTVEKPTWGYTC